MVSSKVRTGLSCTSSASGATGRGNGPVKSLMRCTQRSATEEVAGAAAAGAAATADADDAEVEAAAGRGRGRGMSGGNSTVMSNSSKAPAKESIVLCDVTLLGSGGISGSSGDGGEYGDVGSNSGGVAGDGGSNWSVEYDGGDLQVLVLAKLGLVALGSLEDGAAAAAEVTGTCRPSG